jgi:hypothetical protein
VQLSEPPYPPTRPDEVFGKGNLAAQRPGRAHVRRLGFTEQAKELGKRKVIRLQLLQGRGHDLGGVVFRQPPQALDASRVRSGDASHGCYPNLWVVCRVFCNGQEIVGQLGARAAPGDTGRPVHQPTVLPAPGQVRAQLIGQSRVVQAMKQGVIELSGVITLDEVEKSVDHAGAVDIRAGRQIPGEQGDDRIIAQEVLEDHGIAAAAPCGDLLMRRDDVPARAVTDPQKFSLRHWLDIVDAQELGGEELPVALVREPHR